MEPAVRVHRHALAGVGVADVEGADDGLERREQGVDSPDAGAELARGDAARPAGCCHAAPSTADARDARRPRASRVDAESSEARLRSPRVAFHLGRRSHCATSAAFPSGVQVARNGAAAAANARTSAQRASAFSAGIPFPGRCRGLETTVQAPIIAANIETLTQEPGFNPETMLIEKKAGGMRCQIDAPIRCS